MRSQLLGLGSKLDLSDFTLAIVLLALHSILWPYRGIVHDAQIYAVMALNNSAHGKFAHDLFFAFGSQDGYSLFSTLMGPLVTRVGFQNAFWLGYMASSALLIYAEVRLVRSLIPERSLANLGIVALVVMSLPYGPGDLFHVHEAFFTARSIAEGLSLLGIDAILRKRMAKAAGFILVGLTLQPLMAISALTVFVGISCWGCWRQPKTRAILFCSLFLAIGALAIVMTTNWGFVRPLFRIMDKTWLADVRIRSWQCFLSEWSVADWYWIGGSLGIVLGACKWLRPEARVLVGAAVLTAAGGLATMALGEHLRSMFLIEGQGYRALWLTEVLAVPLGVLMVARVSESTSPYARWAALAVVAFLGDPFLLYPLASAPSLSILFFYPAVSGIYAFFFFKRSAGGQGDAVWRGLVAGMVTTAAILSAILLAGAIKVGISGALDPINLAYFTGDLSSRLLLFIAALVVLASFLHIIQDSKKIFILAASVWVLTSAALLIVQESPGWREHYQPGYKDVKFVAGVINEGGAKTATALQNVSIYWSGCEDLVWFDLGMDSYYSYLQLTGVVFSEGTMTEGQRRAALARPFEVARLRDGPAPYAEGNLRRLAVLRATYSDPPPTREDLLRLANDKNLDWVVLSQKFAGLYSATDGSVYVYNCARIRQSEQ